MATPKPKKGKHPVKDQKVSVATGPPSWFVAPIGMIIFQDESRI